jgi:hypothetical protein
MLSESPRIRCREITSDDLDGIADLLTRGFGNRARDHWLRALQRLSEHRTPAGFPKYGYLLEDQGNPVGAILLIFSSVPVDGEPRIRCSVSSWYVDPAFRSHAAMLASRALKHKQVTYVNNSPAPHTLPILEAQGYARYCRGRFIALPALALRSCGSRVEAITPDARSDRDLPAFETELLVDHARYGCISVTCSAEDGMHPFVFMPRWKSGLIPYVYVVYCRSAQDFVRFAGPLGRFLAWRGFPLVALDSDGPIPGLVGVYSEDVVPKYFRGPDKPRLGDVAYSEQVLFGI